MMNWKPHGYRVGTSQEWFEEGALPIDAEALDAFARKMRKRIEPWLSAVFQSEHLNLLVGSGFTIAIGHVAGASATDMSTVALGTKHDAAIQAHATASAKRMGRGEPNIEDQFRSALALLDGFDVIGDSAAGDRDELKAALDNQLRTFLTSLLKTEAGIATGTTEAARNEAAAHLQSFLLSFASRAASRERLHLFTINYERLIEHGCDMAGLRTIDRFVGALNPVFRSSRVEVDLHYNPPGIRGEPRFMEGVIRFTKLHGSLDWYLDSADRRIRRHGIPFGTSAQSDIPKDPTDTVMVYPNAAKDVETTEYPYAELFRDFAASLCRPNSALVTYGYGFGDDHINRVLTDMLTIPSTHLVILAYRVDDRLKGFCEKVSRQAQISLLVGPHFADIRNLIEYYLPKPALDYITGRVAELMKRRPDERPETDEAVAVPVTIAPASDLGA
jgi:hypothetical protein